MNGKPLPKKVKKKSITSLKKKLDEIFSLYIRQKYADENGYVVCYTCGAVKHWSEIQNGHFISRSYLNTRYDERNVRPQCVGCNVFGRGRLPVFATKLSEEIGANVLTELFKEAQKIVRYYPYQEKIEYYKEALTKL